jgi:hypothetical protein
MKIPNLKNIESKESDYVFVTNISGTMADARNITKHFTEISFNGRIGIELELFEVRRCKS